jgi:hypothetical protein
MDLMEYKNYYNNLLSKCNEETYNSSKKIFNYLINFYYNQVRTRYVFNQFELIDYFIFISFLFSIYGVFHFMILIVSNSLYKLNEDKYQTKTEINRKKRKTY